MVLPQRRRNRLESFDYSKPGAFFVTICAKNREWIFWNVGASIARPQSDIHLSEYGRIVNEKIHEIPLRYSYIEVANYTIMPNHVHLLLTHYYDDSGRAMLAPTPEISRVVQQFKGAVTKAIGTSVWQKSFHDRIIRNEKEYSIINEYIDNNPLKWKEDCFYIKS